jgi:amino acid transporter
MAVQAAPRRRVRVRGGTLGWFLCWAVVFADIGTSVYYVPGILAGHYHNRSALFVAMTLVVFLLLSVKYAEVAWRFPEGGGVVNVSTQALHPFAGLLGGLFIIVDYYLTAALSALSGVLYLSVVIPALHPLPVAILMTGLALVGLGILNALGIKESARVSAAIAVLAAAGQLLVVLATAASLGPAGIVRSLQQLASGPPLTPIVLVTGYAAAFLAFSGLETITQLAPAMREPRFRIAGQAMVALVLTMVVTSPLLTLWSTTLLGPSADPNQYISLLGAHVSGPALGAYVAISGSLLLVFASNTAIIGAYHVFIALSRMGFLPRLIERRNRLRGTPHWAVLLAVTVPVGVVVASRGSVDLLGDLYAFGLLGAFCLTCLSLDIVRWHDRGQSSAGRWVVFGLGVLTTVLVLVAWVTNLVAKPLATEFGGGLTVLGLLVGLATYARRRPVIFPFQHRPDVPITPIAMARRMQPAEVLVVLPHDLRSQEAVVSVATRIAADRPVVFLYRGDRAPTSRSELLEVADPYLQDRRAQAAFALADRAARKAIRDRRYVYIPGNLRREVVGEVWRAVRPRETVLVEGDQDVLPPVALDRVRRTYVDGVPILRLVSGRRSIELVGA